MAQPSEAQPSEAAQPSEGNTGTEQAKKLVEGTRHCFGEGVNKCVQKVTNILPQLGQQLADKLNVVKDDVETCVEKLPGRLEQSAQNIGAIGDKWVNVIKQLNLALSQAGPEGPSLFKPIKVAFLLYIQNIQDKLNNALLGDKAAMAKNMDVQKLAEEIQRTSERYKQLVQSPQFQQMFRKVTDNYSKGLVGSLNAAQPAIDRMSEKFNQMLEDVGGKAGKALGNAGLNLVKSVIAEIPLLGGVIDLLLSIGELSNKMVATCKPPMDFAAEVGVPLANVTADKIEELKCKWIQLSSQTNKMMKDIDTQSSDGAKQKGGHGAKYTRCVRCHKRIRYGHTRRHRKNMVAKK